MSASPRLITLKLSALCEHCGEAIHQTLHNVTPTLNEFPWYHSVTGSEECGQGACKECGAPLDGPRALCQACW